jgi:magnesium-transporting ATPase (P-type)
MYLFGNSRIHVITMYSGHVCVYYASMLRCWHLVWILVMTDHPCLGVGCHIAVLKSLENIPPWRNAQFWHGNSLRYPEPA